MVTRKDFYNALLELGIEKGDSLITHSSFKSLGEVENGADDIVGAMFDAVGECGTVIFPTLCSRDWNHVFENWHLDAPSDVGYLTNYFRKLPGATRSDHATHSVAAMGRLGNYITETHGKSGFRHGNFGNRAFAADSPWEKMYHLDTKILFLGVSMRKCTFRHYAEYCFIEQCLKSIEGSPEYESMKARLWDYGKAGPWTHTDALYVEKILDKDGKVHRAKCGNAELTLVFSKDFVDKTIELFRKRDPDVFWQDGDYWDNKDTFAWLSDMDKIIAEKNK